MTLLQIIFEVGHRVKALPYICLRKFQLESFFFFFLQRLLRERKPSVNILIHIDSKTGTPAFLLGLHNVYLTFAAKLNNLEHTH